MNSQIEFSSDVAFTPTVKAIQSRKGLRHAYARMEQNGGWATSVTPELGGFIAAQTSFYMATANAEDQPCIQHRGGPAGFLQVLDEFTLAFVDFGGNQQFISTGNLSENPKAHLFLMDYAHRRRIKIWGEAKVVEGDADLLAKLMPPDYAARPEQVIVFTITAWDANCPQHIPLRFEAETVQAALDQRDQRIAQLEAELAALKSGGIGSL